MGQAALIAINDDVGRVAEVELYLPDEKELGKRFRPRVNARQDVYVTNTSPKRNVGPSYQQKKKNGLSVSNSIQVRVRTFQSLKMKYITWRHERCVQSRPAKIATKVATIPVPKRLAVAVKPAAFGVPPGVTEGRDVRALPVVVGPPAN